jgi:hypothetical protein
MIERWRRFSGRDLLFDMQFPSVPADQSSICRRILKSPVDEFRNDFLRA